MKERKRYTREFKQEVLQMAASGERSIAELERDLGISPGMIYKWRDRYRLDEADGSLQPSSEQEAAAELRRVKRELEIVRQERDILKKAIEIFSKDQRR